MPPNPLPAFLSLLAAVCLDAVPAFAAPADLDLSFGTGGKVVPFIGSIYGNGADVILQSDGRIVVAGTARVVVGGTARDAFGVARLHPNGTFDTSFNGTGTVTTAISPSGGSTQDAVFCVEVQADGKIVVGGYTKPDGTHYACALLRYNTNGSLDATFNGTGVVLTYFSQDFETFTTVRVQNDGKILAAGYFRYSSNDPFQICMARFNSDGALDPTFGQQGLQSFFLDDARDMLILPDGKIMLAGTDGSMISPKFLLMRCNANGTLDTSFNGRGYALTAVGTSSGGISMVRQNDGKLIVGGSTSNGNHQEFALVRCNSDGTLDPTFNGTGKVTTPIVGQYYGDVCYSLALQNDGRIVAAGYTNNSQGWDFALARYNANGSLDTSFNGTGTVTTSWGSGSDQIFGVAVQSDGKIVVAGYSNGNFLVSRYQGGPTTRIDEWRIANFGTNASQLVAGDSADPERDGLFNLAEYALLLSPTTPNLPPSVQSFVYPEGKRLRMFVPRDPQRNDIALEVQATGNLASGAWTTLATSTLGAPFSGPGYVGGDDASPDVKTVEVRDLENLGATSQRWLRVKVTH